MEPLSRYTVELHRPETGWTDLQAATARVRQVAAEMRREGRPVRFLRSIFVPEDGACFFLFEGPTRKSVRDAAARAGLGVQQLRKTITAD
jgi:hypothetical protein